MLRSRTLLLGLDSGPISFMRGEFHMVFASNNIGIEINVEMIRLYAKFSSTHSSAFQSKGLKSRIIAYLNLNVPFQDSKPRNPAHLS